MVLDVLATNVVTEVTALLSSFFFSFSAVAVLALAVHALADVVAEMIVVHQSFLYLSF